MACSMYRQKQRLWIRHVQAHARKPAGAASQSSQRRGRSSRDSCRSHRRGTRSREHARGDVSTSARSQQTDMYLRSTPEDESSSMTSPTGDAASISEGTMAQCTILQLPGQTVYICKQLHSCLSATCDQFPLLRLTQEEQQVAIDRTAAWSSSFTYTQF